MASVVLSGDTSGTITISAPAVSGSNTQTLVATTGTLAPIVSGTAVASTSGTSIDFTSIPSWVKRITVMFGNVSTSGTSIPLVQLGDSGGIENTGYLSCGTYIANGSGTTVTSTAGFNLTGFHTAAYVFQGTLTISLLNSTTNQWTAAGTFSVNSNGSTAWCAGAKTLSDVLTQVRITTVNGTDTYDAGTINILYE